MDIIRNGKKAHSEEYKRYAICRHMGWDFYTYDSQPLHFIEEILIFMFHEAERDREQQPAQKQSLKPLAYNR